jgi:peptidoglycan-associated lipoprotein
MIGAGLVVKFGGQAKAASSTQAAAQNEPNQFIFTCASEVPNVVQGDTLRVIGHAKTEPDAMEVRYSWSSDGGAIEGSGRLVTINTTDVPAGNYRVTGHASLAASPLTTADCQTGFTVSGRVQAVVVAPVALDATEIAKNDVVFHENVQDALFDYDSYQIRPDAQLAVDHAAVYLKNHPEIHVLVGGYSDERGSAEYNVALSEKRANAARNALIAAGVDADRLEIISYGKETQVCTDETEACWQQNRRAAFAMHR